MHCKAVIFDMDGVIFDSERLVLEGWREIAAEYSIPNIEIPYYRGVGSNHDAFKKVFLEYYGPDFPYDSYKQEMSRRYHERYGNGKLPLKPGVVELLEFLKEEGYLTAVASSTRSAVVIPEIRAAGLLSYFTALICGDMVKKSKPEPDIFLKACETLGVEPPGAIVIEDSYNGIRAAHRAGALPVMVPDMAAPNEEMRKLAFLIFPGLAEVKTWLKSLK